MNSLHLLTALILGLLQAATIGQKKITQADIDNISLDDSPFEEPPRKRDNNRINLTDIKVSEDDMKLFGGTSKPIAREVKKITQADIDSIDLEDSPFDEPPRKRDFKKIDLKDINVSEDDIKFFERTTQPSAGEVKKITKADLDFDVDEAYRMNFGPTDDLGNSPKAKSSAKSGSKGRRRFRRK